jgi:hypothetical protein
MHYRVVLQGRTLGEANLDEVRRQVVRVTGLPPSIVAEWFTGAPHVVKGSLSQTDADRIVATLRAVGAAAVVEREAGADDESKEGVQTVAPPLHSGPPTISPASEGASAEAAGGGATKPGPVGWRRTVRDKWPLIVGGIVLVGGIIVAVPIASDYFSSLRRAQAPAPATTKRSGPSEATKSPAPVINAKLLVGPWRCTDQRTGVSAYWSYRDDGTLIFFGDALSDRPPPPDPSGSMPTGWKLDGQKLQHASTKGPLETYIISALTLSRLRYGNDRGLEVECRRP